MVNYCYNFNLYVVTIPSVVNDLYCKAAVYNVWSAQYLLIVITRRLHDPYDSWYIRVTWITV